MKQSTKDNLQHAAGILIGKTLLRAIGVRYCKADRNTKPFSTVAANLAADGVKQTWWPYR